MIDWLNGKIGEVEGLVQAGAVLMAIVFILAIWWRTRNIVQTLVAMVTAGAVLFAVNNTDWFKSKVESEAGSVGIVVPLLEAARRRRSGKGIVDLKLVSDESGSPQYARVTVDGPSAA